MEVAESVQHLIDESTGFAFWELSVLLSKLEPNLGRLQTYTRFQVFVYVSIWTVLKNHVDILFVMEHTVKLDDVWMVETTVNFNFPDDLFLSSQANDRILVKHLDCH